MVITRETDYAMRCTLFLSRHQEDVKMLEAVATEMAIPKSFLAKIVQKLAKAGVVESFRGAKGGIRLSRAPEEISLLDVIEAVQGPVAMNRCAVDKTTCSLSCSCVVHPVWTQLRKEMEQRLKAINFRSLMGNPSFRDGLRWKRKHGSLGACTVNPLRRRK